MGKGNRRRKLIVEKKKKTNRGQRRRRRRAKHGRTSEPEEEEEDTGWGVKTWKEMKTLSLRGPLSESLKWNSMWIGLKL